MKSDLVKEIVQRSRLFIEAYINKCQAESGDLKMLATWYTSLMELGLAAFADDKECGAILCAIDVAEALCKHNQLDEAIFGAWLLRTPLGLGVSQFEFGCGSLLDAEDAFECLDELYWHQVFPD